MKKLLCMLLCILLFLPLGTLPAVAEGEKRDDIPDNVEQDKLTEPMLAGIRVALGEDLTVRFYIKAPQGAKGVSLLIDGVAVDGTATYSEDEGMYVYTYTHLSLLFMAEEMQITPTCRMGGIIVKGRPCRFSPRDYAMRLLAAEDTTPTVRDLLVAMLNFGAAAQVYNGHEIYNLANDYLNAIEKEVSVREYASVLDIRGEATQDAAVTTGISIVVSDVVAFKIYVDIAGQENLRSNGGVGIPGCELLSQKEEAAVLAEGITMEIADNPAFENASAFPITKIDGAPGYRTLSCGIYAAEYSTTYYARLCTADGYSQTLLYSVETYLARGLATNTLDADGYRMVTAMMAYGDALRVYRASLLA